MMVTTGYGMIQRHYLIKVNGNRILAVEESKIEVQTKVIALLFFQAIIIVFIMLTYERFATLILKTTLLVLAVMEQ